MSIQYCRVMCLYRILWTIRILWQRQRQASPLLSPCYLGYILWCPFVLPHEHAESHKRPLVSTPNGAIVLPVEIFITSFHSIAQRSPSLIVKSHLISFCCRRFHIASFLCKMFRAWNIHLLGWYLAFCECPHALMYITPYYLFPLLIYALSLIN